MLVACYHSLGLDSCGSLLVWHGMTAHMHCNFADLTQLVCAYHLSVCWSCTVRGNILWLQVCILVVSPDQSRALLVRARNSKFPPGMVTCPTGFVEQAESAEQACSREVLEETGVTIDPTSIKVLHTQAWPQGSLLHRAPHHSHQQCLIWLLARFMCLKKV